VSRCLVLDSEALSALAGRANKKQREVRAALAAAARLRRDVVVPALVLAELYRSAKRSAFVDACLSRETGLRIRDTDRAFARLVGGLLSGAGAGSELIVDAHVVAAAIEAGGGVILTGDPRDLERIGAPYQNLVVVPID
jgi:predicted nucleic acid-binding protein